MMNDECREKTSFFHSSQAPLSARDARMNRRDWQDGQEIPLMTHMKALLCGGAAADRGKGVPRQTTRGGAPGCG